MIKIINIFILILILLSTSCVKIPLEKKVANYWEKKKEFLTDKDLEYYLSEESLKDKKIVSALKGKSNTEYVNIKIINIKNIDKKTKLVTIKADAKTKGYVFKGVTMKQKWILENGEWRLYVTAKISPF